MLLRYADARRIGRLFCPGGLVCRPVAAGGTHPSVPGRRVVDGHGAAGQPSGGRLRRLRISVRLRHRAARAAAGRVPQLRGIRTTSWSRCPRSAEIDCFSTGRRSGARAPRRWEAVALRCPSAAGLMVVKRVVGLPGEEVEVRNGDVYINGRIARKDLAQQRELAILVHDAGYQPTFKPAPPPRWRVEGGARMAGRGWAVVHTASAPTNRSPGLSTIIGVGWVEPSESHRKRTTPMVGLAELDPPYHRPLSPESNASVIEGQAQRAPSGEDNADGGARGTLTTPPTACALAGEQYNAPVIEMPVTDLSAYDAAPSRGGGRACGGRPDASFRLTAGQGRGTFCNRATDGREDFEVRMRFDNRLRTGSRSRRQTASTPGRE